jgi:hypothetical protein
MFFELLKSLVGFRFNKTQEARYRDGRFSVLNKTRAVAVTGGEHYQTNLELSTDFSVAGFIYDVKENDMQTDFSGYNKKYITDLGVYDPVAAFEDFGKHFDSRRMTKQDPTA